MNLPPTPLESVHTRRQHGIQLNNRYLNRIEPAKYKRVKHTKNTILPKIKKRVKILKTEGGTTKAKGTHNEIILLFDETPLLVGHFDIGRQDIGWQDVENFIITETFENVKKAPGGDQRHVDANREIQPNNMKQAIEIKYMNGHGMFAPTHVRSSYSQFEEITGQKYLSPSGYIVASYDIHYYTNNTNKPLLTVWFVPITNIDNWFYMYSNNISVRYQKKDHIPLHYRKINFYSKGEQLNNPYKSTIHDINSPSGLKRNFP